MFFYCCSFIALHHGAEAANYFAVKVLTGTEAPVDVGNSDVI